MDIPLLVTNPTNIRYLTGFVGVGGEREAYVLLTKSDTYLFTNALYREETKKLTQNPVSFKRLNLLGSLALQGLAFVEVSREEPFAKELNRVLQKTVFVKRQSSFTNQLGFEETDLTVAEYKKLKSELKGVTLVPTKNRIEELRMIKRDDEITNIKAAAKLTDQCFTFILSKLTPGVEESEIAWEIEAFIRKNGATLAFSPIVAFGKNSSQPHYTKTVLSKGQSLNTNDIALLDFGARANGYCSDMTRVVFVGKPKDEWRRAYQMVLQAQQAALEYLTGSRPVTPSGTKADRLARDVIEKAGFPPYPHSLGHGVGLAIHEIPRLIARKDRILLPGMVFTIEPGIYVQGSYGIRIEDLILLKKEGIEVLSQSQKKLIIL